MTKLEDQFAAAKEEVKRLSTRPDNDTLLELYSFYKQASEGDVSGSRPGPFDFSARAKYDAWDARRGMTKDVAMKTYIKLVQHLKSR